MSRIRCPDCNSSDGLADYGDHTYCHSCTARTQIAQEVLDAVANSYFTLMEDIPVNGPLRLPESITSQFSQNARQWLLKGGVTATLAKKHGIGFVAHEVVDGRVLHNRVILPSYTDGELTFYQARAVDQGMTPKYINFGKNAGIQFIKKDDSKTTILVEDMLSGIRVGEHANATVLFGTSLTDKNLLTLVQNYSRIFIWLDPDDAGRRASEKLMKKLRLYFQEVQTITSKVDPKCLFDSEIRSILAPRLS